MQRGLFIAGDWGTSNLRLALCSETGAVLDERRGPGVASVQGQLAETFDALVSGWTAAHGVLPAVLCGMVGSAIGWTDAGYVACPAEPATIAASMASLRSGAIRIAPGLSCRNVYGSPDVMRGEETQLLGALALTPQLRTGAQLLCLPGTHTKWVLMEQGAVREFLTAATGELFALLCRHSVLVGESGDTQAGDDSAAFARGLARIAGQPGAELIHRLFECRSLKLFGELSQSDAAPYLSGVLIGSDVAGALAALGARAGNGAVTLIGTAELTERYALALAARQRSFRILDGAAAVQAGLLQLRRMLQGQEIAA